jgi:hypothetical protein
MKLQRIGSERKVSAQPLLNMECELSLVNELFIVELPAEAAQRRAGSTFVS